MTRCRLVLCVISICPALCLAQQAAAPAVMDAGAMDGSAWEELGAQPAGSRLMKAMYIRGVFEGVVLGESALGATLDYSMTYAEAAGAVDEFYSDPRNRDVWVLMALQYIAKVRQGLGAEELESELARMRAAMQGLRGVGDTD